MSALRSEIATARRTLQVARASAAPRLSPVMVVPCNMCSYPYRRRLSKRLYKKGFLRGYRDDLKFECLNCGHKSTCTPDRGRMPITWQAAIAEEPSPLPAVAVFSVMFVVVAGLAAIGAVVTAVIALVTLSLSVLVLSGFLFAASGGIAIGWGVGGTYWVRAAERRRKREAWEAWDRKLSSAVHWNQQFIKLGGTGADMNKGRKMMNEALVPDHITTPDLLPLSDILLRREASEDPDLAQLLLTIGKRGEAQCSRCPARLISYGSAGQHWRSHHRLPKPW